MCIASAPWKFGCCRDLLGHWRNGIVAASMHSTTCKAQLTVESLMAAFITLHQDVVCQHAVHSRDWSMVLWLRCSLAYRYIYGIGAAGRSLLLLKAILPQSTLLTGIQWIIRCLSLHQMITRYMSGGLLLCFRMDDLTALGLRSHCSIETRQHIFPCTTFFCIDELTCLPVLPLLLYVPYVVLCTLCNVVAWFHQLYCVSDT